MAQSRRDNLLAFFRVQPEESERVALLLLLSLFSVGGIVITGQLVGRAMFLSALPPSAIPLRFIVPPLLLVVATAGYTRRMAAGHGRVMERTFLVLAVAVVVARALCATPLRDDRLFLLALFSLLEIAGNLSMILFWTLAGIVFDPREARRLFGLVSSGSALANVAFGLFLGEAARRVAPEDLMALVFVSLLAAGALARRLLAGREAAAPASGAHSAAPPAAAGGLLVDLRASLASPLVATLGAIAIVIALVANVTDYQLDLALKQAYGSDGPGMVAFLARLRLFAGALALGVQVFLAGRFMERYGVLPALLMLPALVGLGSAGVLMTGGALWAVAVPRAADVALKYSVNDSAFNLLYLPLAPAARSRAKALVDGVLKPPMVAALGLVFLFQDRFFGLTVTQWALPVLALLGVWGFLLLRAERGYVAALSQSIALRRLDATRGEIAFADETSRRVLAAALAEPNPAKVIHALTLLRQAPEADWDPLLRPLLVDGSEDVRLAVLELLAERPVASLDDALRARLDDPVPSVREAACRAFARAHGAGAVPELTARLADPDPGARGAAVVALVRHGGLAGFLHAGAPLHAMLGSADPDERREGARVLGQLGVPSFYHPLLELIADPDRRVRQAAIQAAGHVGAPELQRALADAAADPGVRPAALHALVQCGAGQPDTLAALLRDPARPADLRQQVARALPRLGAPAGPLLVAALLDADDSVRGAAAAGLLALREQGDAPVPDVVVVQARLDAELRLAFERFLALEDVRQAGAAGTLLEEALVRAFTADRARVLDLLGLLHARLPLPSLREALTRGEGRKVAEALELVDSVAASVRGLAAPCLGGNVAQRLEAAEKRLLLKRAGFEPLVTRLCASPSSWWRAIALDALARAGAPSLAPVAEGAADDPDPLVRGAARAALAWLAAGAVPEVPPMPLVPLEQILFLKQVPLFRDIPGEEVAGLLEIVEEAAFAPGETILRQGDAGDALYIVVEGQITIDVDGVRRPGRIGPRDVIGELSILTGEPRAATCVAETDVVALRIRREPFWELMREHPEVSLGVIRILVTHLRRDKATAGAGPDRAA